MFFNTDRSNLLLLDCVEFHFVSFFHLLAVQVRAERVQPDPAQEVQGISGVRQNSQDHRQTLQLLDYTLEYPISVLSESSVDCGSRFPICSFETLDLADYS